MVRRLAVLLVVAGCAGSAPRAGDECPAPEATCSGSASEVLSCDATTGRYAVSAECVTAGSCDFRNVTKMEQDGSGVTEVGYFEPTCGHRGAADGGACCFICGRTTTACGDQCAPNGTACSRPPGCACEG